jgi:hypothetical protein
VKVRVARWILLLAALSALVIFFARRQSSEQADPASSASARSMSPEETRRLVEQALAQPRNTVRFQWEPSSADPQGAAPLPPPAIAPPNAPPLPTAQIVAPAAPAPASTGNEMKPAVEMRKNALQKLTAAFVKIGRAAQVGAQFQEQATPAPAPTSTAPGQ